jgi:hypothetical protein
VKNTFLFLLLFFGQPSQGNTQLVHPANNEAFLQDEVATIRIQLAPDSLALLLSTDSINSNYEYTAQFIYESSTFSDTVNTIGFRLRGNTSRFAQKKSFKIAFNTYQSGQKWHSLEKMNLNGEHNDVSILRSQLSNMVLREAELPSSRTSYVKLYINNEYKGLYLNVEHIDEEFLQRRFINDDSGNLYKCSYGANLAYLGTNPSNYEVLYELKTNKTVNDYTGLISFISILNNSSNTNFACDIQEVLDVDLYLKSLAAEILMGQWDGYTYNSNNYYLYQRPSDGKFVFIEYDMDNTYGVDWSSINWSTRSIYNWSSGVRPLYTRIMAVPYFKDRFSAYVDSFLVDFYSSGYLVPQLEAWQSLITPAALADDFKGFDYGFTDQDFLNAITLAWGGHIPTSISSFIVNRSNSANLQTTTVGLTNPCILDIAENQIPFDIPIRAYNLLGQPVPITTTQQLIVVEDAFGNRKKIINF